MILLPSSSFCTILHDGLTTGKLDRSEGWSTVAAKWVTLGAERVKATLKEIHQGLDQ
jgi:hypothetical protein